MSQKNSKLEFVLRKLQSLSGFLPLCIFLLFHVVANATAIAGPDVYYGFIHIMGSIPGIIVLEALIIFLPLLVHGLMGLYIVFTGRNNPMQYPYFRNRMFFFQRVSGVVIFVFLIYHVLTVKYGSDHSAALMMVNLYEQFHSPIFGAFYIITLICVSFHVCNGLWGFCVNWGILPGMRAQRVFGKICIVLFVILLVFWLFVFAAIYRIDGGLIEQLNLMSQFGL